MEQKKRSVISTGEKLLWVLTYVLVILLIHDFRQEKEAVVNFGAQVSAQAEEIKLLQKYISAKEAAEKIR